MANVGNVVISAFILLALGLAVSVFLARLAGAILHALPWTQKLRTQALERIASELDMRSDPTLRSKPNLPLFDAQGTVRNCLAQERGNVHLSVFDYEFVEMKPVIKRGNRTSGEHSMMHRQTVAAQWCAEWMLPRFKLRPERLRDKLSKILGTVFERVLPHNEGQGRQPWKHINFHLYPTFSQRYHLEGREEPSIRQLFSEDVLRFFTHERGWSVEGGGEWIIAYRPRKRVAPRRMAQFIDHVNQMLATFPKNDVMVHTPVLQVDLDAPVGPSPRALTDEIVGPVQTKSRRRSRSDQGLPIDLDKRRAKLIARIEQLSSVSGLVKAIERHEKKARQFNRDSKPATILGWFAFLFGFLAWGTLGVFTVFPLLGYVFNVLGLLAAPVLIAISYLPVGRYVTRRMGFPWRGDDERRLHLDAANHATKLLHEMERQAGF